MPDDLSGPACREYLDKRLWMDPSTDLAMELLDAVQHKNYFDALKNVVPIFEHWGCLNGYPVFKCLIIVTA